MAARRMQSYNWNAALDIQCRVALFQKQFNVPDGDPRLTDFQRGLELAAEILNSEPDEG
jgi:hypothetical protein